MQSINMHRQCDGHTHDEPFPDDPRGALAQAAAEVLWAVTLAEIIEATDHLRAAYRAYR